MCHVGMMNNTVIIGFYSSEIAFSLLIFDRVVNTDS